MKLKSLKKYCISIISGLPLYIFDAFWVDAVVYETTTGLKFDWLNLFTSKSFWTFVAIHVTIMLINSYKDKKRERALEDAINNGQIDLVNAAVTSAKKHDFDSAEKILAAFDELGERRHKENE